MIKVRIPPREKLYTTGPSDPVRFYYHPILKYPFLRRLEIVLGLMKKKGGSVLDVGYGSGIFFTELNGSFENLFGIDIHDHYEAVSRMLLKDSIIAELKQADVSKMPYPDNRFDCVLSVSTLEHLDNLTQALKEISRVLKADGEAILGFPSDNPLMRALHYVFDRTPHEDMHVSNESRIISEINKVFEIERMTTFPSFLPARLAFYVACRCVKKRGTR